MNRPWLVVATLSLACVFALACAGSPVVEGEIPAESPFTWALIMSWSALTIGGGSALVGIWIDRDRGRPVAFAVAMSGLIATAMCVGGLQGYLDEEGAIATRADLNRMLDMVDDIAASSDDPALTALADQSASHRRGGRRAAREAVAPVAPEAAEAPVEDETAPQPSEGPVEDEVPAAGEQTAPAEATTGGE